ncbi:MAG: hypothetical protein JWQ89_2948, partial [Devosia sp.]|uniref:hypothetical protein n=1 Tax=Devosia sp. TaxID=1871048 RepID=UPI0026077E18
QWWERTKREIRCHEVEQILASDEAFAEAMREIDPSLVKPLTPDEVDRLVKRVISAPEGAARPTPPLALRLAASGVQEPKPQLQAGCEYLCALASEDDARHLASEPTGRLSVIPAPPPGVTHLRIGDLRFPLSRGTGVVHVEGVGRADIEAHLDARKNMGLGPDIELVANVEE